MELLQLLGLTLFPASLSGVVCNGLVIIATWKSRSMSHSFSLLTATQALFSGVHSTMFLFYVTPMYVLDIEFLLTNSYHCGFIMLVCWDVSVYSHFLIALNRFCAVFYPLSYRTVFDARCTKIIISLTIMFSVSVQTVFFQILPCRCSHNPDRWSFSYNRLPICQTYTLYNAIKVVSLTILSVLIDLITISKVRRARNLIKKGRPLVAALKKKEVDFLKQSFSQSMFQLVVMPTFYLTAMLTKNKVIGFVIGNVFWCLIHALDGAFTLGFNSELRKGLQKKQLKSVVAVNDDKLDRLTPVGSINADR